MAAPESPPAPSVPLNRSRLRRPWRRAALALLAACTLVGAWHVHKPLPPGVHVRGAPVATPDAWVRFLADITAQDGAGGMIRRQVIHEATLELVRGARDLLVLDYFLFNGQGGPKGPLVPGNGLSPVSAQLLEALRRLKQQQPDLPILVLTDPINDYYRGTAPAELEALRPLGIDVVVTRLSALRDPNPLYSAPWRTLAGRWLPARGEGWLPNVLDGAGPRLHPGALLQLPNFKANHRKLAITGDGAGSLRGIVASANPHDASSAHSNVALRIRGEALRPLLHSELAVARFSGWKGGTLEQLAQSSAAGPATEPGAAVHVAIITEGAIREALLGRLDAAVAGDAIDIAQFYLSDRRVLRSLLDASARGARVRVLLDPNRDAFGFEKGGIPNRPVGNALLRRSRGGIALRWYRTSGEQFHAKFAAVRSRGMVWFTLGSANFTRRNLADYNLEANVEVLAPADSVVAREATGWFDMLWNNAGGVPYSDPPDAWAEDSLLRLWRAGFMEATGLSTF